MRETHSTVGAIFSRLEPPAPDGLMFGGESQRGRSHTALFTAHMILLEAVELQRECFKIEELESVMETCVSDFTEVWKGEAPRSSL